MTWTHHDCTAGLLREPGLHMRHASSGRGSRVASRVSARWPAAAAGGVRLGREESGHGVERKESNSPLDLHIQNIDHNNYY